MHHHNITIIIIIIIVTIIIISFKLYLNLHVYNNLYSLSTTVLHTEKLLILKRTCVFDLSSPDQSFCKRIHN